MAEVSKTDTDVSLKKNTTAVKQIENTDKDLDCLQENVIVAPYSLAILGQVMLLATKKDFSLISKPTTKNPVSSQEAKPEGTADTNEVQFFESKADFKYITHPESFRATLVQVSNAGYRAFLAAHSNMDKIRLACDNVEQHVELVTECVVEGDNNDVKTLVPVSLESMRTAANNCAEWSREIVTKFHDALDMLEEVHCSCHASQMTNEEKIKELERRKNEVEIQKAENEENKKERKEEIKKLEEKIEQERKDYERDFEKRQQNILKEKKDILDAEYELGQVKLEQERAEEAVKKARKNRGWWNKVLDVETKDVENALNKEGNCKQKASEKELSVTKERGKKNAEINSEVEMLKNKKQTYESEIKQKNEEKGKSLDELAAFTEKISAAIIELNTNGVEKLDLEGIKKLLKEGIVQVAELEKKWKMLVLFFEGVANVVQVAMGGAIEDFSNLIDKAAQSDSLSRFMKKKIILLAFNAYSKCSGVSSVATTYLKISNDFLMPSIVELGTLLALDSEQDAEEIKQKTESIQLRCKNTVEYIGQVVKYAKVENANQVTSKSIEMK